MKKRILITDDDPGVQDIFRLILERAGYEVLVNDDGNAILEDQFELPHIFLLDKQLSGYDGTDLCKHLKTNGSTKDIPVIMISAYPGIDLIARSAGADDFLEKPFLVKDLLYKVAKHLK